MWCKNWYNAEWIRKIHGIFFKQKISLEKLVKYLSDDDFKYLTKEFRSKNLELLKQKGVYPYEYMDNFKTFSEEKLPD